MASNVFAWSAGIAPKVPYIQVYEDIYGQCVTNGACVTPLHHCLPPWSVSIYDEDHGQSNFSVLTNR